jgi:hypothetical protein
MLRRIFGVKRGEVGGNCFSSIISRMIMSVRTRARHVAFMGEKKNMYRFLVGKPKGKRPLGRPTLGGNIIL